jgi:hypothetical protein
MVVSRKDAKEQSKMQASSLRLRFYSFAPLRETFS